MRLPTLDQFRKEVKSDWFEDLHKREIVIRLYWKDKKWYDPGYMLSASVTDIINRSTTNFYNSLKDKNER